MAAMFFLFSIASAGQSPPLPEGIASRDRDLIYGRKYGMSLTMDRLVPAKPNGKAVVWVVSGGWFSNPDSINPATAAPLCKAGYQVFAVCHGSQPRFTIPEILDDMHRSTRWIRANASRFQVDPVSIGVTGGSAGGHLSLMLGMVHRPGDAKAKDPVDRQPSGCQAVACFFPPTDFLNWTRPGEVMLGKPHLLKNLPPAFDFHTQDKLTGQFRLITDEKERERIGKEISPISHISAGSAPVYLVQGTSDLLVPQSQAETFMGALKEKGIAGELVIKRGAGHGWAGMDKDLEQFAIWFDKHLAVKR
jgi:acetyl esterase/lipase